MLETILVQARVQAVCTMPPASVAIYLRFWSCQLFDSLVPDILNQLNSQVIMERIPGVGS